jgi:hypothetical protein
VGSLPTVAIEEIIPGLHHWTQVHPRIRSRVHSHYVTGSRTLIDPLVPDEGIEWFDERGVERVVLSNRHHLRHAERFAERFGAPILCHAEGLHEFSGGPVVEGYTPEERLADDVTAFEMDAISPDDAVLAIDAGGGALLFADAIINHGALGFVSDGLIGDDPEGVKRKVRERAAALCEREPDHLLFAHGDPVIGGGAEALRRFAAR